MCIKAILKVGLCGMQESQSHIVDLSCKVDLGTDCTVITIVQYLLEVHLHSCRDYM